MRLPNFKVEWVETNSRDVRSDAKDEKKNVRRDALDMDPNTAYRYLQWKMKHDNSQDYKLLNDRFKHDAIARRVVAKPAEDATRNGWRLVIPDDPKKQDAYQDALDKLRLNDVLTQQLIYQRLHGDGYITFGIDEKNNNEGNLNKPLTPENIKDVTFVHAFGQNNIQYTQYTDDPTDINYKKEQCITITPTQSGVTYNDKGMQVPNSKTPEATVIDKSRYFHISLDKFEDDDTGTSIITRCSEQLKAMNIAIENAGKMLREFTFKVFKSDKILDANDEDFENKVNVMSQIMNTESVAFIGNEDELVKVATPVSGIDTLFSFIWQDLSAASNIPKSVLTGEQAGSLAGASQDVVNYYDTVKAMQETLLKPEIEYIVKLLMSADDVAGGQEDPDSIEWHIEFNPLWSPDDKTQSETLANHANAASTLVGAGIYDPDEAKQMLDGQANNAIQGMQATKTDSSSELTQEQIEQYLNDMEKATHGSKT